MACEVDTFTTEMYNILTNKEEEKELAGTLAKKVRGRRRYQMIDNILISELYADTKWKAKKRVEWRMLSLQLKDLPLGRTL